MGVPWLAVLTVEANREKPARVSLSYAALAAV